MSSPTDRSRLPWILAAIVLVCAILPFGAALEGDYVNWDDERVLQRNEHYRGFSGDNVGWMFSTFYMGHYQPLTWLSYALDYTLFGVEPAGYHAHNLLWHALGAMLLFFVIRRLLMLAGDGQPAARHDWTALFAALFFAVHPLRVESVAWLTERRDLLSGCGLFATVLLYLRIEQARRETRPTRGLWAALLVCYIASLLSKAWGMALPVVLLLLDGYPLRRLSAGGWRACLVEKVPMFVLAVATAFLASRAQVDFGAAVELEAHGVGQRVAQAAYGLCFYLWTTLWPAGLSPLYPIPWGFDPWAMRYVVCGAIVLAAAAASIVLRRRLPGVTVAAAYYVVVVAPVLGFLQSGPQLVADRYSFLSCIGWAVLLAAGLRHLAERMVGRNLVIGLAVAWLAVLGVLSAQQTRVWKNSITLWEHALSLDPDVRRSHVKLGAALVDTGRRANMERAVGHYQRAIDLPPEEVITHRYLGDLYARLERYQDAISQWELYLAGAPGDAVVQKNIRLARQRLRQREADGR